VNPCTTNRVTLFQHSAPAAYSVRRQVPGAVFQSLATAFVLSRLDYCNSVLAGLPQHITNRYQSFKTSLPGLGYLWNPPLKTQDRTQWKVWGYEDPNSQKCTKKVHTVSILKLLKPVLYVLLPGRIPHECRCFLFVTVSQQLETVVLFSLVSLLTVAVLLHIT